MSDNQMEKDKAKHSPWLNAEKRGYTCAHCSRDMRENPAQRCSHDGLCVSIEDFHARRRVEEETGKPNTSCVATAGDWPEDFSHENGNYFNNCCECKQTFIGHKRRIVCNKCANEKVAAQPEQAAAPELEDSTLLPCPFCGEVPTFHDATVNGDGSLWIIGCQSDNCSVNSRTVPGNKNCYEILREDWNNRSAPASPNAERELSRGEELEVAAYEFGKKAGFREGVEAAAKMCEDKKHLSSTFRLAAEHIRTLTPANP